MLSLLKLVNNNKALPTQSVGRANQRCTTFVHIGAITYLSCSNASCPITWANRRNLCHNDFLGFSAGKLPSIFFVSDASQPFHRNRASFSVKLGICTPLSLLPFYIALWLSSYFSNIFLSRPNIKYYQLSDFIIFVYTASLISLSLIISQCAPIWQVISTAY